MSVKIFHAGEAEHAEWCARMADAVAADPRETNFCDKGAVADAIRAPPAGSRLAVMLDEEDEPLACAVACEGNVVDTMFTLQAGAGKNAFAVLLKALCSAEDKVVFARREGYNVDMIRWFVAAAEAAGVAYEVRE